MYIRYLSEMTYLQNQSDPNEVEDAEERNSSTCFDRYQHLKKTQHHWNAKGIGVKSQKYKVERDGFTEI